VEAYQRSSRRVCRFLSPNIPKLKCSCNELPIQGAVKRDETKTLSNPPCIHWDKWHFEMLALKKALKCPAPCPPKTYSKDFAVLYFANIIIICRVFHRDWSTANP
jgi:hypothetical protein